MAVETLTNENREEFNRSKGFDPAQETVVADTEKKVEPASEDAEETKPRKKHSIDERLEKLASQKREAIAKAESAEAARKALQERLDALEKPAEGGKPDPSKYTDPVKYAEDLADWRFKEKEAERAKKAKEDADAKEEQDRIATWAKRLKKFSKEVDDLDEVTENANNMRVVDNIRNAIMESDFGPQIYYYFAKNEEELERINEMPAAKRLIAFGKLEDRFERDAAKAEEEEPPRRRLPPPPEPITTLKGKSITSGNVDSSGQVTNPTAFKAEMRKKIYGY